MSKLKPEVGDIWEDKNGYKVLIVKTMFSYAEGVSENYIHRLIFKSGFGTKKDDNFDECDYLGKSKANIDDLFKTENEE